MMTPTPRAPDLAAAPSTAAATSSAREGRWRRRCDAAALVILAAIALIALFTFRDYGPGWDDYTHAEYGELMLKGFASDFADRAAFSFVNLFYYGAGFDVVAALIHQATPLGLFDARRLTGAAVGLIGLAVTWRLGRRLGGPVAGLAALILLATCPLYYGHMFMNPKDVPFAVAMAVMTLGLVRLAERYPFPPPEAVMLAGTGTGLALGTRILGGLAAVYAAIGLLPLLIAEARHRGLAVMTRRFGGFLLALIPGLIFGYLVMGLIWPWGVAEALNPLRALRYFSAFFEKPWKELFNGTLVAVPDMPWSYLPTLFTLQLPEGFALLMAGGVGLALAAQVSRAAAPAQKSVLLVVLMAALFPLLLALVQRPALYNGVRHFIFVLPPMAALAGLFFAWAVARLQAWGGRGAALAASAAVLALTALPVSQMIRLHPYQYVYFNHAAGGLAAQHGRFMTDYWGLALKEAAQDLRAYIAANDLKPPAGRPWKIAVCGPHRIVQVTLGHDLERGRDFITRWDTVDADFALVLDTFYCRRLDAPVLATISRNGVPLARVHDVRGRAVGEMFTLPPP